MAGEFKPVGETEDKGIKCPKCFSRLHRVTGTNKREDSVSRYRMCLHCKKSFITTETIAEYEAYEKGEGSVPQ